MQHSDDFPMTMEIEIDLQQDSHNFGMPMQGCPPVAVAFGLYPVADGAKSKAAGYPVYRDVEFVKIAIPGDRNSLYFQPATDVYRKRFPKAYDAFRARGKTPMEGMPIDEWAPVSRSVALNLKTMHIHTVEALAAVHEGHIDRIGGNGRELRAKAQAWLEEAKSGAASNQLAADKQKLQDQLEALQAQIVALQQNSGKKAEAPAPVKAQADPTDSVEADVAAAARRPRRSAA